MSNQQDIVQFEQFMKVANFFLVSSGLELYTKEPSTPSRTRWLWLLAILMIGNLWLCTGAEIIEAVLMFRRGEISGGTAACIYISTVFIASFKILSMFYNKIGIIEFLTQLKQIFPNTPATQKAYEVRKYYKTSIYNTMLFSIFYMGVIWMVNLLVLVEYLVLEVWLKRAIVGTQLPYFPYVPWDFQYHWSYGILYISEAMAGNTTIAITVAADLILCASTIHLIMHFDYLNRNMVEYQRKSAEEDMKFLKSFIAYHNYLYR